MDKIVQQKQFVRVLFEAKVSRKTAVGLVRRAFEAGVLQKKSTTMMDFDYLSKRIVSQYYYNFKKEDADNIYFKEESTAKALQKVTSVESIVDVIDRAKDNSEFDLKKELAINTEVSIVSEESVRQEEESLSKTTNQEAPERVKMEKKSFWDL